jgi:hypothetical protein
MQVSLEVLMVVVLLLPFANLTMMACAEGFEDNSDTITDCHGISYAA